MYSTTERQPQSGNLRLKNSKPFQPRSGWKLLKQKRAIGGGSATKLASGQPRQAIGVGIPAPNMSRSEQLAIHRQPAFHNRSGTTQTLAASALRRTRSRTPDHLGPRLLHASGWACSRHHWQWRFGLPRSTVARCMSPKLVQTYKASWSPRPCDYP